MFDYDVGLNDLIQLMFRPQDVRTTSNVDDKQSLPLLLSQLDNKPVDEFASDKEIQMVCMVFLFQYLTIVTIFINEIAIF